MDITGILRKLRRDRIAMTGIVGIGILLIPAIFAPLLANGRPFVLISAEGVWSFPFWRTLFSPDSTERLIGQLFNYTMLALPGWLVIRLIFRKHANGRKFGTLALLILLVLPFVFTRNVVDKRNYRAMAEEARWSLFAPIPYGDAEIGVGRPYEEPSARHWFGTDEIGRDVASRMIYGGRVSLAVGILAAGGALLLGVLIGMFSGYHGGSVDLLTMRAIEILICFPSFLLLLILMSILKDRKFDQSILIVIGVIALTGWMGLAQLVRGEVLKLRELPYMQSCRTLGMPWWRTYFIHLLPNLLAPVLITFAFAIAGAILTESALSFLGFGVQPPTPSWGALLKQATVNPFRYWHLTLAPGAALFLAIAAFNFTGEGLRRTLPK